MTLLEGEAEALTRRAVEVALEGDVVALKLCLGLLVPPARSRRVELAAMPEIRGAADVRAALAEVLRAVAEGEVSPEEGASLAAVVEANRRAIETTELLARIERLERAQRGTGR